MKQAGDHEGLEPEEVNGIRSMQSYVIPSESDLLDLGDLELLVHTGQSPISPATSYWGSACNMWSLGPFIIGEVVGEWP